MQVVMATPVINSVLCYISTARHTKTDEQIVQFCLPFYDLNIIREAKDVLFKYTEERNVKRRGDDCKKSELTDILQMFRKLDEDNVSLPTFVSDSFDSMPPSAGYDLLCPMIIISKVCRV